MMTVAFKIHKKNEGFTIIEVVAAMLIVGILAVMALPQVFDALQNFRLNAAAAKVLADIRYARELALSRRANYGIEVNQAGNFYQIFSLSGNTKTVLTDPHLRKTMTVDFDTLTEFSGVTISAVDFCQSGSCAEVDLRFNSFGVPYDSAGTTMASLATLQLSAGGVSKTIQIHQQTALSEVV